MYVVYLSNVSFSRLITSVGEERVFFFFCSRVLVIVLFLCEGVAYSSICLGKAALFYCDTPNH